MIEFFHDKLVLDLASQDKYLFVKMILNDHNYLLVAKKCKFHQSTTNINIWLLPSFCGSF